MCEKHPVHFAFVGGNENPADAITRCLLYNKLMQSNFYSGPSFLSEKGTYECYQEGSLSFMIPNSYVESTIDFLVDGGEMSLNMAINHSIPVVPYKREHLIPPERYSRFHKLISVTEKVLRFVTNVKVKLNKRDPLKYSHFEVDKFNLFKQASKFVIIQDQQLNFPEIFQYFHCENKRKKDMPNLVGQLNVYVDKEGLLRVRSKCDKIKKKQGGTRIF